MVGTNSGCVGDEKYLQNFSYGTYIKMRGAQWHSG